MRAYGYIENAVDLLKDFLKEREKKWIRVSKLQGNITTKYKIRIAKPSIRAIIKRVIKDKDFITFPKKRDTQFKREWWVSYKGSFEKKKYRCGVCYTPINKIFHIKENEQDIIRAVCPNSECGTYLKLSLFNQNIIPRKITACQHCGEKKPIYLKCPTCDEYLCKNCIVYHEKVLHINSEIPNDVKCYNCKSIYIELQCSLCDNWYCARCFPKNRKYTSYWFDNPEKYPESIHIDNPLKINSDSVRDFLDTICIKCINFSFNCDDCDKKGTTECKKCLLESRIQIFQLAKEKLEKNLKQL
ncbi:MAG: hypothetical protein GF329_12100 [Candidatus Lokiarchaeota archaeon]|nr:hypothetical protein [Candidatus Lokiarchaeota archaeon]